VFAVPDETTHRTKIADWMELEALVAPDGRIPFGTLVSATALTENEQKDDIAEEDMDEDRLVLRAQGEIARRRDTMGDDYPFRIDENGRGLNFVSPVSKAGSVYLFCLFLSHATDRDIISQAQSPKITNATRDLFQACATVAAGGYVGGPAMSFGFPRPDGATFLKTLKRVYKLFGDGKPHKKPRVAAARAIKDNGIDIIAWRRSIDGLPCTFYLIAQVASGGNWHEKSVIPDRLHFHQYWFEHPPGSQPQDAMFVPFGLAPEEPEEGTSYEDLLVDHMQSVAHKFGTLIYRDRLAGYAAIGLKLFDDGEENIERVDDIKKIVKWVSKYMGKLRTT
jgi:hypothetical protein